MTKIKLYEFVKVLKFILIINISFSLFLFTWVTDDDLYGLPKDGIQRYISLFYYSITTFSTTGFGDIYDKSVRMKLVISLYMIFVFAITTSFLFDL